MQTGHAGRLVWKPCTDAGRNADMSPLPHGADRHYSTESVGGAGRSCSRRSAWHTRDDARIARTLAFIQWHAVDDHLSSCIPAAKSIAFRETESLGRHAAGARATRKTDQRKTAKLFSVIRSMNARVLSAKGAISV